MGDHSKEVESGQRFEFGANWTRFLSVLNDERIRMAEASLRQMLDVDDLRGKHFLDAGSGSGLFSLAARRLGAKVHSFDYDPQSVACALELKRRYFPEDSRWTVDAGSVLDNGYLAKLGEFDVVYSWGVLHHTGAMWNALENVVPLVAPGGQLFISIYNDQAGVSKRWRTLKRIYNGLPGFLRFPYTALVMGSREIKFLAISALRCKLGAYLDYVINYQRHSLRGMNYWHDVIDWIGGYPFEVAKPEEIFDFYRKRGFILEKLRTCAGGHGCNEFVFRKQ